MRKTPLPKVELVPGEYYWVRDSYGVNDVGLPMIVAQWRNYQWWACGSGIPLTSWRIVPLAHVPRFSPKENDAD